jgi:hypothetical protein
LFLAGNFLFLVEEFTGEGVEFAAVDFDLREDGGGGRRCRGR